MLIPIKLHYLNKDEGSEGDPFLYRNHSGNS